MPRSDQGGKGKDRACSHDSPQHLPSLLMVRRNRLGDSYDRRRTDWCRTLDTGGHLETVVDFPPDRLMLDG